MAVIGSVTKWLLDPLRAALGTIYRELEYDPGSGANETAEVVFPPGIDAEGLPGDMACIVDVGGRKVAVGWVDTRVTTIAAAGEVVIFSRSAPGVVAAKIHVRNDGNIILNNGVTITPDGDVLVGGISFKNHKHTAGTLIDSNGSVTGNTGGPT